jgi:hypothetical protein
MGTAGVAMPPLGAVTVLHLPFRVEPNLKVRRTWAAAQGRR